MRPHRLLATLTTAAATAATAFCTIGTAHASSSADYVALGDSYSSGLGAGSYISSSGSCDRSTLAYSALWANANSPASYSSVACSGATTADVINSQVSALSSSTTLVSLTIGGNDLGFSSVMETCVIQGTSACVSAIDSAENQANTTLPGKLDNALNAIRSHAPNATVVVLDYPDFYDLNQSSGCIGLSTTSRSKVDEGANVLDGQIQAAAGRAGDVFADVRSAFSGHEICDGNSWLHSVDWFNLGDSYHPTASGQSGAYYPVFAAKA